MAPEIPVTVLCLLHAAELCGHSPCRQTDGHSSADEMEVILAGVWGQALRPMWRRLCRLDLQVSEEGVLALGPQCLDSVWSELAASLPIMAIGRAPENV